MRRNANGDVYCFVCGAGEMLPTQMECDGLDLEDVLAITGREPGTVAQILPRINTPGVNFSTVRYSDAEIDVIKAYLRGME